MTITVTSIDQGPFTATGLAQTVAYTFMTLSDEEISVFYDEGFGRTLIDPALHTVTRNKNIDGSAKEGGSVQISASAAPAGSSIYLRANPRDDRDLVWSDTGSRLKNLNEEQDRLTLRQLVLVEMLGRAVLVSPGRPVPSPEDVIDAALAVGQKADRDGGNLTEALARAFLNSLKVDPVSPELYGAKGDGVTNDVLALTLALASGRPVRLKNGAIYRVNNTITIPAGAVVYGKATIRAHTTFTDQFLVAIAAGSGTTLEDFTVDGQSPATGNIYGIRAMGSTTNLFMQKVTVQNVGFTGIDLSSNTGAWTHTNAKLIDCAAINCPWIGISIEGGRSVKLVRPYVRRTGYDAIAFREEGLGGVCVDADVSKATAPFRVFNSNPEKGMLLHKSPDWELDVVGGSYIDNRTAGEDGIGVGEDGAEHRRWSVRGAYVKWTGLFGIDPAGNCVCEGNTVEFAGQQAIHLGLDLGGVMRNIIVGSNLILDANEDAGETAILIGGTLNGAALVVANVKVSGNIVVDRRATKKTLYAFGVDSNLTTYSGLSVTGNDFRQVGTASFLYFGANGPGADYQCWGNTALGFERRQVNPTPTAQTGTLGTVDRSVFRYQRRGKMIDFTYDLVLNASSGAGSGGGALTVPLPVNTMATFSGQTTVACSVVNFSGFNLNVAFVQDNVLTILAGGGNTAITNGLRLHVSGCYEAASSA